MPESGYPVMEKRRGKRNRMKQKIALYNDSFQNFKSYGIPKAQLVIADIPFNIGENFYGSNPMWYKGGDRANGESTHAGKAAFYTDYNFNLVEYFHFCNRLLRPEPKDKGQAPCMIVFCSFEQIVPLCAAAEQYGFKHNMHLSFIKNYSPQVLKANMRICGATEHAVLFWRDKLPKFRNDGKMVFDWFPWERDGKDVPKIHPTQKPVKLLKRLIELFTDPGEVVIDPCAGSGSTLRACLETGRSGFGFEICKDFYRQANDLMLKPGAVRAQKAFDGESYQQIAMV